LFNETEFTGVDLIVATPSCQGISVANHKKKMRRTEIL